MISRWMFLVLPLLALSLRVQAQNAPGAPSALQTPITLSAQLSKTAFKANEPVGLVVTLTNDSDKEVPVGGSAGEYSSFELDLRDANGQKVKRTQAGERFLTPPEAVFANSLLHIAPHGERKLTYSLTQLFDLSAGGRFSLGISRVLVVSYTRIKYQTDSAILHPEYQMNSVTLHAAPLAFSIERAPAVSVDGDNAPFSTSAKFVLTAEADGSLKRFRVGKSGSLSAMREDAAAPVFPPSPVPDSVWLLTTPDGRFAYVVTGQPWERNSKITAFRVNQDGFLTSIGTPLPLPALWPVVMSRDGRGLFNNGLMARIGDDGRLQPVSGFEVGNIHTLALSPDGQLAFGAANPVSAFRIAPDGKMSPLTEYGWRLGDNDSFFVQQNGQKAQIQAMNVFISPDGKKLLVEATIFSQQRGTPNRRWTSGFTLFHVHPDAPPAQLLERVPGVFSDLDGQGEMVSTKPLGFDPSGRFVLALSNDGALLSFDVSGVKPVRVATIATQGTFDFSAALFSQPVGLCFDADGHTFYTAGGGWVSEFRLGAEGAIEPLGPALRSYATSLALVNVPLSLVGSDGFQARLEREVAVVGTPIPLDVRVASPASVEVTLVRCSAGWGRTVGENVPLLDAGRGAVPLRLERGGQLDLNRLFDLSLTGIYGVRVSVAGRAPVELTLEVSDKD